MSSDNIPHNFDEDISNRGFCSCFSEVTKDFKVKWDFLCISFRRSFHSTKMCITEKINNLLSGFDKFEDDDTESPARTQAAGNKNGDLNTENNVCQTNSITDDETRCEFCKINVADVIIIPCGHSNYCNVCLEKWYETSASCPKCNVTMFDVVQCI